MAENAEFLGVSLRYPLQVGTNGRPLLAASEDNIKQSINSILTTPLGTRFYLEEYGSNLHKLTFKPQNEVLLSLLRFHIPDALEKWEKRINLTSIEFEFVEESKVDCLIFYRILSSNEIDSFIFPFYRELIT